MQLCGEFAGIYPNDPGILSPFYLNVLELKPYEGFFVPAGIMHAYIHGFALECMANSDNVLRGGLTPKHIDIDELFSILDFNPYKPEVLEPVEQYSGCFLYKSKCAEFVLYLLKQKDKPFIDMELPGTGIFTVFEGNSEVSVINDPVSSAYKTICLKQGESVFISERKNGERLRFSGTFTLFAALIPP